LLKNIIIKLQILEIPESFGEKGIF